MARTDVKDHGGADELLDGGVGHGLELADLLLGELGRCDCAEAEVSLVPYSFSPLRRVGSRSRHTSSEHCELVINFERFVVVYVVAGAAAARCLWLGISNW